MYNQTVRLPHTPVCVHVTICLNLYNKDIFGYGHLPQTPNKQLVPQMKDMYHSQSNFGF